MSEVRISFLRHGPTGWNVQGRVQGHTDIGLSPEGLARMEGLRLPADLLAPVIYCSPLTRCRQTAQALGLAEPVLDARLMEQNWGSWEGLTRDEMRARDGEDCFIRAGERAAFCPPGGESTQAVMDRLSRFLADLAPRQHDAVVVTHLGVIRAAYTLATGWDMATPMPPELDVAKILVLCLDEKGVTRPVALNRDFEQRG